MGDKNIVIGHVLLVAAFAEDVVQMEL